MTYYGVSRSVSRKIVELHSLANLLTRECTDVHNPTAWTFAAVQ